jgi:hypothetical protein
VAEDVDLPFNNKAQRPPRRGVIPFDAGRRDRNDFRPIASAKVASEASWPGFWPKRLAGTGPIFLLAIAALCALYPSLKLKKSTATHLNSDDRSQAAPAYKPSPAAQPLSSSLPITPALAKRPDGFILPAHTPNAPTSLPASSALHYHSMKYEATHKRAFGSCTGQLELTSVSLHFKCAKQPDLNIPVASIADANKDGVVLASGEKYHFLVANHTKGQVEAIFILWLNKVKRTSSEASF